MRETGVLTVVMVGVAGLGGLYWNMGSSSRVAANHVAEARVFHVVVPDSLPLPGTPIFKARQGDSVTLVVRSSRAGELHVHGYERAVALERNEEVRWTFGADAAGIYPLHLHDPSGRMYALGLLEVDPR
jgi:hypothetical protein